MESETIPKVKESLKHFLISICRLHRQNRYDRYDATHLRNKLDDMIQKDTGLRRPIIARQPPSKELEGVSYKVRELDDCNAKLVEQLKLIIDQNKVLQNKVNELERVRVVKLMPKDQTKKPLLISQEQFEYMQKLKNKINELESRYEKLARDEAYDEKLLTNYQERINIFKNKIRALSGTNS